MEIKQTDNVIPEDVVDVGEYIHQHEATYRVPLLSGGAVFVKKIGFMRKAEILTDHKEFYQEFNLELVELERLKIQVKGVQKRMDEGKMTDEMKEKAVKLFNRSKEVQDLMGDEPENILKDFITEVIIEPAILKEREKLDKFMSSMKCYNMDEYLLFTEMMGDFLGTQKKT